MKNNITDPDYGKNLEINIPLRFGDYGERTEAQKTILDMSVLHLQLSILFSLLQRLGREAIVDDEADSFNRLAEAVELLSIFGGGMVEAAEMAEGRCLDLVTAKEGVTIRDIQDLDETALIHAVSGVLNNPNLPAGIYDGIKNVLNELYNAVNQSQDEFENFSNSPEYIDILFKKSK